MYNERRREIRMRKLEREELGVGFNVSNESNFKLRAHYDFLERAVLW